ncbi:MAG: metal ABC transporter permease [Alphaproteobacteria bacterium]
MSTSLETIILLAPALVAGAVISLAHVPLGQEVLKRGIIFLDLAVAQFAALGMITFQVLANVDEYSYMGMYGPLATGIMAALACAFSFQVLEKYAGRYQEALIGCAFILAACLSLILMANDPHGGEEMKNILAGQILWIDWVDIQLVLPIFITAFLLWILIKNKRGILFYPLFALVIPFAVNMIGIYLVFASLIFPALAVVRVKRLKMLWGIIVSVSSYAVGLSVSYAFDWPAGPSIVMTMALISLMFAIFGKKRTDIA